MGSAGTGGAGGMGGAGGAGGGLGNGLVLWYKFDEAGGMTVADSSGNARNTGIATIGGGTGSFSTTHQVGTGAVNLGGTSSTVGAYVNVPTNLSAMGAGATITIACWVNITTARNWARLWDFNNSSTTGYMFLSPQEQTNGFVRFAITQTNNGGEQMISSAAKLPTGWHHIAITLDAASTGTMYIDGTVAGTNTAMTLRPTSIGATTNNWIGRSAFTADPYLAGLVDDFRVYNRALSASEITTLYGIR
jgi:hypothetical protein